MSTAVQHLLSRLPGREINVAAGTVLFHRGDQVETIHWIRDGTARLLRRGALGQVLTLQTARAGSVLAEASLFSAIYHCDGETVTAGCIRVIPTPVVRAALAADPTAAQVWMRHLGIEAQAARMRAEILSLRTVTERLDSWLEWRDGALPGRGGWRDLATDLGVSPEALYRELARRRAKKLARQSP